MANITMYIIQALVLIGIPAFLIFMNLWLIRKEGRFKFKKLIEFDTDRSILFFNFLAIGLVSLLLLIHIFLGSNKEARWVYIIGPLIYLILMFLTLNLIILLSKKIKLFRLIFGIMFILVGGIFIFLVSSYLYFNFVSMFIYITITDFFVILFIINAILSIIYGIYDIVLFALNKKIINNTIQNQEGYLKS